MRARDHKELSETWKQRIGKKYIAISLSEQDMVSHEMMNGFTISKLPNVEGVLVFSFSSIPDGDIYTDFEASVVPMDEMTATGFLQHHQMEAGIFYIYILR